MNMPPDMLKPQQLPRWLRGQGFLKDPGADGVYVNEPPPKAVAGTKDGEPEKEVRAWGTTSLYARAGLIDGQRIVAVHFFDKSADESQPRFISCKKDLIEAYSDATTGCSKQASAADPRPAPAKLLIEVEPRPAKPQILVAYPLDWRNEIAVEERTLEEGGAAVAAAQLAGILDKDKEYVQEWLDLKQEESDLNRVLQVHDQGDWDEPRSCLFQHQEAQSVLDNIWLNCCAAWRAQTKAQEQEDNEKKMAMQVEVLRRSFETLFAESQQEIDMKHNRPIYGWMSTDFDSRGHLLEARRVRGGFSDEKLSRICQIYGQGSPGLRGAEEHIADIEALLSCLHLFAGSVARKVNVVYERRKRWAARHGLRIADPALPRQQIARENDATQWSNFVSEASW